MERMVIVLSGPESSGKSALCKALSEHFLSPWIPEFARTFLAENGPHYDFETLQLIYQGHLDHQAKAKEKQAPGPLLILDTDSINFKIWANRVFNQSFAALERGLLAEQNHHYLLCYPDLNWEPDPLRENPNDRLAIFQEHQTLIESLGRPHQTVSGEGKARFNSAVEGIQKLRGNKH